MVGFAGAGFVCIFALRLPPFIFTMSSHAKPDSLRQFSSIVHDGADRAPNRSMLRAVGFQDADFQKPIVGVASTWSMLTPCNMHIDELARQAGAGADAAGGKSIIFGTITVADGISMGTLGMRYSLVSREVIADSIETVCGAEGFDGLVAIGGCDKNMPGCVMAMARLNRPSVFVYGGTILPGLHPDTKQDCDIVSVFEAVGQHAAGKLDAAGLATIERCSIPGPGSCGGMYTANTMASAIRSTRLSLPNSSTRSPFSEEKRLDCQRAGAAVLALAQGQHPPARHPHEKGIRERHHRRDRPRRLDQRRAPPARHRAHCRREALHRRLYPHRQTRARARRPEAVRQIRHGSPLAHSADSSRC